MLLLALALAAPSLARASGPVVWDDNGDGIDDRIGYVQANGYRFSFENADTLARQRFEVIQSVSGLIFGVYVRYDHAPTNSDLVALTGLGVPVQYRLRAAPALRVRAPSAQIGFIRQLSGVVRIEVVPVLYASTRDGCAAIGMRDPAGRVSPTVDETTPEADGRGVVVAILDTGINDAPVGAYPGHESLIGRCLGGGDFTGGDSLADTPPSGSVNPADPALGPLAGHGTHVASIILGSGGSTGFTRGVAPAARFVDVRVLGPLGAGTGLAEALDWCIANRARDWGSPDTTLRGIDVVNLSLSGLDTSDGLDLVSQLCNAAARAGIVVVAAMGNDGLPGHVPPPAAADSVVSVGAFDDQRSGTPVGDVAYANNNAGPRAGDQDADPLDELKPTLLAPGVAVLAANGNLATDGTRYVRHTGTSMAAAFASGAAAAIRSYDPALDPGAVAATLIATARRNGPGVPAGLPMVDPRWTTVAGFGLLDVYAALLELRQKDRTQIRRLMLTSGSTALTAEAWTMRERGAPYIVFERAADVSGAPGPFAPIDSVAAWGDSSLADGQDTRVYARTWTVPPAEYGTTAWYRIATTEGGVRSTAPPARTTLPTGPSDATAFVTIVHDAYDTDVSATLRAVGGGFALGLPGSSAAVATDYVDGVSATGTIAQTFQLEIPQGAAAAWLPPSQATPWALDITEGGFLNRSGRLTQLEIVWHSAGGDVVYAWGPGPLLTVEGQEVEAELPSGTTAVSVDPTRPPAVCPNPGVVGGRLTFARPAGDRGNLEIFDLAGRRVAAVDSRSFGTGATVEWRAVDQAGQALAPGVYLARFAASRALRVVLLPR